MAEGRTSNPFLVELSETRRKMLQTLPATQLMPHKTFRFRFEGGSQNRCSFERALKNTVETQPYTAVAIALGIGWLLGRMHRPL